MFGGLLFSDGTLAGRLELAPEAPVWAHFGAAVLLYLHIAGGAVGLVTGAMASATRKGGRIHRLSGKIFFVSMFVAYLIGAGVAPFLSEGQRPNFVAGILALYLLISGLMAARRRQFQAGNWEKAGLAIALLITGLGGWFAYLGANSETGTVDGSPPQAFILFITAGTIAAVEEFFVLVRGKLSELGRKTRHLWRMCFSFFIASGSLFFGQPQVFPSWFSESILPVLLGFAPLLVMFFWLILLRLNRTGRRFQASLSEL